MYTELHLNRYWRLFQEIFVIVHGGLVAWQTGGPDLQGPRLWPMFVFGFSLCFVLTQVNWYTLAYHFIYQPSGELITRAPSAKLQSGYRVCPITRSHDSKHFLTYSGLKRPKKWKLQFSIFQGEPQIQDGHSSVIAFKVQWYPLEICCAWKKLIAGLYGWRGWN